MTRTIISIDQGKITVTIDDQEPVEIKAGGIMLPVPKRPMSETRREHKREYDRQRRLRIRQQKAGLVSSGQSSVKTKELNFRDPTFMDPWDCQVCRNAGSLCVLHEGMEKKGLKPLMFKKV